MRFAAALLIFAVLSAVSSCRKDNTKNPDLGLSYVPDTVGHYTIYNVTYIRHDDPVNLHDTLQYQLKEKIESEFTDNEGRRALRLERYRRDSVSQPWTLTDVWYSTKTSTRYEKVEEDTRYIRLVFPVSDNQVWNGNALNNQDSWDYSIMFADEPLTVNGLSYDSVAFVKQHEFKPGFYFHEYSTAAYARNVGLIMMYEKLLEINLSDTTAPLKGTEWFQELVSYGVE
jgi:hypothetical protein